MAFIITTTGVPATVVIDDLGERTFVHPVVSYDLETGYSPTELSQSADLQAAITGGEITAVDGSGNSITLVSQLKDLQSAYNSSLDPEIITDTTLGAVTIRRGSASDVDNIIVGQRGSGADVFTVTGAGNVAGSNFNGVSLTTGGAATNYLDATGAYSVPVGAGASVTTDNTLWVAKTGGTAHGSRTTEISDPYDTIAGALGDALSGDTVMVLPGSYSESPGIVPAGVSLVSQGGYEVTAIIGAAVTGNRITLSSGSVINGFNVTIPSNATNAIEYAGGASTVAGCRFIKFTGQAAALGSGLANTGAGKTVAFEIRYGLLDCENILLCSNGILAIQSLHVPGTGTVQRGAKVSGGRLQALDMNIGNANVLYGVEIGTGGIAVLISLNLFNLKNGLLVTGNDAQIDALGGKIQTTATIGGTYGGGLSSFTGRSLVVDASLSLSAATIRITAQMEPNFVFNNTLAPNAASSDFSVNAIQATTDKRDASQRLLGTDSQIGFPEKGAKLMTGEGGPNATFNHVVQMNAADAAVDVTTAAESTSAGTFTFGSVAVNEKIAWCSIRRDGVTANLLKVFGIILNQNTAGTDGGAAPTYVFEIWDGGAWAEVGVEAISEVEQYRYANNVFLRASSLEQLRLGINPDTTWATSTIDSVLGYWARVRIATIGSALSLPTFNQLKTAPSLSHFNEQGKMTASGSAMWRQTLFGAGNMWGEGGGAADYTVTVGNGSIAAGTEWSHKNKKGRINNSNDFVNFNFTIPGGVSTAHTLKLRLLMSSTGSNNVDMRMSVLPIEILNNLIADPTGGVVPTERISAGTYDSDPAQVIDAPTFSTVTDTIQAVTFDDFDISNYYEDDMLAIRVGFDPGGSSTDVDIWALVIEGVAFTSGKIL